MLAEKRPDIQIVGDELHPLLKITDFAPYIAKIKASGADTVVTGNWGQDIALLLKAAADAGLKVNWYTYYAGGTGGPTAIKQANLNHQVFQITEGFANLDHKPSQEFEKALRAKYDFSLLYPRAVNQMRMFAAAAEKAKSLDPVKVAQALEGMEFEVFNGGEGTCARTTTSSSSRSTSPRSAIRTKRSRSTRKRPAGAGSWSPRSTPPRPCCRPPARWNGRKRPAPARSLSPLAGRGAAWAPPHDYARLDAPTRRLAAQPTSPRAGEVTNAPSSFSQATPCRADRHLHTQRVLYGTMLFLMASWPPSSSACSAS